MFATLIAPPPTVFPPSSATYCLSTQLRRRLFFHTASPLSVLPLSVAVFSSDWYKKLEMSVPANPKKTAPPPIVKLNNAFKLAEVWVKSMSGSADDETTNVDTKGRPHKLGLGAKVPRESNLGLSNDPVERKLHGKLNADKRKAANIAKESTPNASDILDDDDDEDDEEESRTNAFAKRKTFWAAVPLTPLIPGNKKRKLH